MRLCNGETVQLALPTVHPISDGHIAPAPRAHPRGRIALRQHSRPGAERTAKVGWLDLWVGLLHEADEGGVVAGPALSDDNLVAQTDLLRSMIHESQDGAFTHK